jgi:hypothetical protein
MPKVTPMPMPALAEALVEPGDVGRGARSCAERGARFWAETAEAVVVGSGLSSGAAEAERAGIVTVIDSVLVIVLES